MDFRGVSDDFEKNAIEEMAAKPGRHYVVSKDGRLLKLQVYDSAGSGGSVPESAKQKKYSSKVNFSTKTTKIIYPTSASASIQQFVNYSGRYVQRTNNTSMSIRDFVEAKGSKHKHSSKVKLDRSVNINCW